MSKEKLLTAERLREILDYDPETGIFAWRERKNGRQQGKPVGSPNSAGYLQIMIDGKNYRACRLAWLYITGDWPKQVIDHLNGKRSDDRFLNLRHVPQAINTQNIKGPRSDNIHGFLGATFDKKRGCWYAQININKKHLHLGRYSTPEDAHQAYLEAKRKLHEGCTI